MRDDFDEIDVLTALSVGLIIGLIVICMHYKDFDKFCPECGHRYKTEEYCSYDGSELKMIGEEK